MGLEGWSFAGGMVDTPKVGRETEGTVMADMSGDVTEGLSDWMGATLGLVAGVPLGLIVW